MIEPVEPVPDDVTNTETVRAKRLRGFHDRLRFFDRIAAELLAEQNKPKPK